MAYTSNNANKISKEKLDIIKNLSGQIKNLPPEQAIVHIMSANRALSAKNMAFTEDELNSILDDLLTRVPKETSQKVAVIRKLLSADRLNI